MKTVKDVLETAYENAMRISGKTSVETTITEPELLDSLAIVLSKSEQNKGVYTVVLTSVVYKILHPEQDVRKHQASIPGGYSGRNFDTKNITPFLKEKGFPAMAESGWLTRSMEHKVIYDWNYTGAIKEPLKHAFLYILDTIESGRTEPELLLDYVLQSLIITREKSSFSLSKPVNLSINDIILLLDKHFHFGYRGHGAARLPVLAIYAVYSCLIKELKRFDGKKLLPLEKHTSADSQSGRIGDIDVVDLEGEPFEAVEIKFDIPISSHIVEIAKKKIERSPVSRYYILSTKGTVEKDVDQIDLIVRQLKNVHGCQLIVNGIKQSLNYYLRLINDTSEFIKNYTDLLLKDTAVLFEQKQAWNDLVSSL